MDEWTETIDNFIDNLKPESMVRCGQPSVDDERDFSDSVLVVNEAEQVEQTEPADQVDSTQYKISVPQVEGTLHRTSVPVIADHHFTCQVCKIAFATQAKIDDHMEVHNKKHKCPVCGMIFEKARQLVEHSRTHSGSKIVQCTICEKKFTEKGLKLHNDRFHLIKRESKKRKWSRDEKEKYEEINVNSSSDSKTKKHILKTKKNVHCDSCNKYFTIKGFKLHSARFHKEGKEITKKKAQPKKVILKKLFTCGFCQKKFSHLASMRVHEKVHTGGKPHQCDMCDSKFSNKFDLYTHEKVHSALRPFKCEDCAETFKTAESLRFHNLLHSESQPRNCSYCDKTFKNKNQLELHERVHIGEKPFDCSQCEMSFETATKLTRHITSTHMMS